MGSNSVLRVGIISAKWGVVAHLPAWRAIAGVEVVAICTSRRETAEKAARENHIPKAYWDYHEMAADPDIDIIDVGTRPNLRVDMIRAAVAGGKHVYAGIPFADSLANARLLTRELVAKGLQGATDAYTQWLPQCQHMKELIDEGYLGDPWGFSGKVHLQLFSPGVVNVPDYAWFWERRNGASVLRNLGAHLLTPLIHMFGPVESVVADLRRVLPRWQMLDGSLLDVEVDDHATLMVKLENGMTGTLDLCWASGDGEGFRLAAHGADGRLEVVSSHFPSPRDAILRGTQSRGYMDQQGVELAVPDRLTRHESLAITSMSPVPDPVYPMACAMKSLVDGILTGSAVSPDFHLATHVQEVIAAAEHSSAVRSWCPVADMA